MSTTIEAYQRVKEIFLQAVDLEGEARQKILAAAESESEALAAEVRRLLELAEEPTGWLCRTLGEKTLSLGPRLEAREELLGQLEAELRDWDRFSDTSCIGAGGMGAVFRAVDPRLKRVVAVKFLVQGGAATRARFRREAELQARVDHRNVLEVYETGEVGGRPYLVMRHVAGPSLLGLREELAAHERLDLLRQVASGLQAAHSQGLIHRDIKPSNVLVERVPDGWRAFLSDFGIAMEASEAEELGGGVLGSPRYMAPEQLDGRARADVASDLYGLGATFYEFLSGRPLYPEESLVDLVVGILSRPPRPLEEVAPDVPAPLAEVIMRCLERDPARRHPTAAVLLQELETLSVNGPFGGRRPRKSALAVTLSGAILLVAVGLGALKGREKTGGENAAYSQAVQRLSYGDALGARKLLEEALARSPRDPYLLLASSMALSDLGFEEEARTHALQAVELDQDLPEATRWVAQAHLHRISKEWPQAIAVYRQLRLLRPKDLEIGLDLARTQAESGDAQSSLATVGELRELASVRGEDPRLDFAEAQAAADLGDFHRALAAARRSQSDAAVKSAPNLVARSRLLESWSLRNLGAMEESRQAAEQARVIAEAAGDRRLVASAWMAAAGVSWLQGDLEEAERAYRSALKLAEAREDRFMISRSSNNLALVLADRGDLRAALDLYERSREIEAELGSPVSTAYSEVNIARLQALQGNLAAAEDGYRRALKAFLEGGDRRAAASSRGLWAELLIEAGDLDRAWEQAEAGLELATEIREPRAQAAAWTVLGRILQIRSRFEEADLRFEEAVALLPVSEAGTGGVEPRLRWMRLRIEQGRLEEAAELLDEAARASQGSQVVAARAAVQIATVEILAARGKAEDTGRIREELARQVASWREIGLVVTALEGRLAVASFDLSVRGDASSARTLAEDVRDEARRKGLHRLASCADGVLASTTGRSR
ncbi:MAG: protein kinase [Acidobacteria bacterium]|nr:protein kinase [Acidobacteriota bacterium]